MAVKCKEITKINSLISLFGSFDENVRVIAGEFGVDIKAVDSMLTISGEEGAVAQADKVVDALKEIVDRLRMMSPLYDEFLSENKE